AMMIRARIAWPRSIRSARRKARSVSASGKLWKSPPMSVEARLAATQSPLHIRCGLGGWLRLQAEGAGIVAARHAAAMLDFGLGESRDQSKVERTDCRIARRELVIDAVQRLDPRPLFVLERRLIADPPHQPGYRRHPRSKRFG